MNLIALGTQNAPDGHGVIANPIPAFRCCFAAGDVRTWTSNDDVMDGVCGVDEDYRAIHANGEALGLCAEHIAHVRACPTCSPNFVRYATAEQVA